MGVAIYTGAGVGAALVDVGISSLGVISPIPGTGLALKAGRAARAAVEAERIVEASKLTVEISRARHAEAAQHIEEAIASGKPSTLTIGEAGSSAARRREALRGTRSKSGLDRDEYPPAMFEEGGAGASVKRINPSDNRGAGACMAAQCKGLNAGDKVNIKVVD